MLPKAIASLLAAWREPGERGLLTIDHVASKNEEETAVAAIDDAMIQ